MSGLTIAHGGLCQLCHGYSQLLTQYADLDLCPVCWQEQLQEHDPDRLEALLDMARHKVTELSHGRSG